MIICRKFMLLLFLFSFFQSGFVGAQTENVADKQIVDYYEKCLEKINCKKVLGMADVLESMSMKKKNPEGICLSVLVRSKYYSWTANLKAMEKQLERMKKLVGQGRNSRMIFLAWNGIINYYIGKKDYSTALEEIEKYQTTATDMNNPYCIAYAYCKMGDIYAVNKIYDLAFQNYQKGVELLTKHKIDSDLTMFYIPMGSICFNKNKFKESREYFEKSIPLIKTERQMIAPYTLLALDAIYMNDMKEAEKYIDKLAVLAKTYPMTKTVKTNYNVALVSFYTKKKEYTRALIFCDSIPDTLVMASCKQSVFEEIGDTRAAYNMAKLRIKYKDSMDSREVMQMLADYSSRLDNNQLIRTNAKLALDNAHMKIMQIDNEKRLMRSINLQQSLILKNKNLIIKRQKAEMSRQQADIKATTLSGKNKTIVFNFIFCILVTWIFFITLYTYSRRSYIKRLKEGKIIADKARAEAEASDRLKSLFLENMSHEIRTPLNAIIGFTNLLNSKETDFSEKERAEFLDIVQLNSDILITLINDILDLSRLESGIYELNATEVKVTDLCRKTMLSVQSKVRTGVILIFEDPTPRDQGLIILTDAARVQQVLINFLTNSCKYTDKGFIKLTYHTDGNNLLFSVTDTGIGVPKEKAETIFNRFEKIGSFKSGTGLGLSICQKIAEILKGRVYLDTSFEGGAKFVFVLPVTSCLTGKNQPNITT